MNLCDKVSKEEDRTWILGKERRDLKKFRSLPCLISPSIVPDTIFLTLYIGSLKSLDVIRRIEHACESHRQFPRIKTVKMNKIYLINVFYTSRTTVLSSLLFSLVVIMIVVLACFSLTDHSSSKGGAVTDTTSGSKNTSLSIALHVWQ